MISFAERHLKRRREVLLHIHYLRPMFMLDMSTYLNVKSGLCFVVFFFTFLVGVGRTYNLSTCEHYSSKKPQIGKFTVSCNFVW